MTKFEYYFDQTVRILLVAYIIVDLIKDGINISHWLGIILSTILVIWCTIGFVKNLREYRKQNQEQ